MSPQHAGIVALLFAVSIESLAQMSLKIGAAGGAGALTGPWGRRIRKEVFRSASFWTGFGVALYAVQILIWTFVLERLDVSAAFPMGSLCFVGVALLSQAFLGERVDKIRWLGVLCILAGSALAAP